MSSSQSLREFISQRLTAAAAEIFTEFERTIVQYEEEIDRQRRLLDITLNPQIKLQRTDLQQDLILREDDDGPDQQLFNQDRNSSLDQMEPGLLQIKEELEEEELGLKQEAEIVMVTSEASDVTNHNEPEPSMDLLLSPLTEDQEDSEPSRITDPKPKKRRGRNGNGSNSVDECPVSEAHRTSEAGKQPLNCDICGKVFQNRYLMRSHKRIHTGDKRYPCIICNKRFTQNYRLLLHMRIHTGEKPYACEICGERFTHRHHLTFHMRRHTGEKPYSCTVCHKTFAQKGNLIRHTRTHTGEKPYICKICDNSYTNRHNLTIHMRTHIGKKCYSCQTCGKSFFHNFSLTRHKKKSCV